MNGVNSTNPQSLGFEIVIVKTMKINFEADAKKVFFLFKEKKFSVISSLRRREFYLLQ